MKRVTLGLGGLVGLWALLAVIQAAWVGLDDWPEIAPALAGNAVGLLVFYAIMLILRPATPISR